MDDAPAAEFDLTVELVRALLADQHPDLAGLPLRHETHGWDNDVFRLGDDLAVRMPRREVAQLPMHNELAWLAHLAPGLPVAVPAPVRAGEPGCGYPWQWAVVPWFDGVSAATLEPAARDAYAGPLGTFLGALHRDAPGNAPRNAFRGTAPSDRSAAVLERLSRLDSDGRYPATVTEQLSRLWHIGVTAAPYAGEPVWLHGDPHPHNVVVDPGSGHLVAVIDFGDVTSGDPASDLGVAWLHFTEPGRERFFAAAAVLDADLQRRARAWAVHYALMMLLLPIGNPLRPVGEHALGELLDEQR
jgi:aminoglycoside phosphotransferase (APT) family kinase protein